MFQILNKGEMILKEGETGHISLELTVPFACDSAECMLVVTSFVPEQVQTEHECTRSTIALPNDGSGSIPCTTAFREWETFKNISVIAIESNSANAISSEYAVFINTSVKSHPFMDGNTIGVVRVSTVNAEYIFKRKKNNNIFFYVILQIKSNSIMNISILFRCIH